MEYYVIKRLRDFGFLGCFDVIGYLRMIRNLWIYRLR